MTNRAAVNPNTLFFNTKQVEVGVLFYNSPATATKHRIPRHPFVQFPRQLDIPIDIMKIKNRFMAGEM